MISRDYIKQMMVGALFLNLPLYIRHLSVRRKFSEWKSGFTLYFSQCESFITLWRYVSLQFLATKKIRLLVHFTPQQFWKFPLEWTALAAMLTVSRGVQPCTLADSTLCSMRYWLVPLVTGLFLACSACYWPVPWLFRLLMTCSLVVPLVTDLFLACSACYWLVPLVPCFRNVQFGGTIVLI